MLQSLFVAVLLAAPPAAPSVAPAAAPPVAPAVPALDPRIKPDKITESAPLPLPGEIVQPLPAIHRIPAAHAPGMPLDAEHFIKARAAIDRGLAFLRARQSPSGAWMRKAEAGTTDDPTKTEPIALAVTGLGLKAFMQAQPIDAAKDAARDPSAQNALRLLLRARQPDGTFGGERASNYINSCVAMGLASVGTVEVTDALQCTIAHLKASQWDDGEGLNVRQDWYGGAGYGNGGRPDLSNTQMMLDALHDAGVSPDDPAVQRALAFVSRTQNLKSTNASPWAQNGTGDGGFVYTSANGGESMASDAAGEGRAGDKLPPGTPRSLRSYGSMTYAGFKSMLYAGLSRDDERVKAAYDWIRRNYTFDENPGLGQQGLFYYFHAMARALAAAQQPTIAPLRTAAAPAGADSPPSAPPAPINWREALIDSLAKRQRDDGSWVNTAERWMEAEPELVTIYAVLALEEALK